MKVFWFATALLVASTKAIPFGTAIQNEMLTAQVDAELE